MVKLDNEQIAFFEALKEIQDTVVNVALCNNKRDAEDLLYDVTYQTIYSILELIDGHVKENIKLDIIDTKNGKKINSGIQLHDVSVNFIKYEKWKLIIDDAYVNTRRYHMDGLVRW